MNPDDVVLVALVNSERDLELAVRQHWYRIRQRHAPRHFSGAQYLAFYLGSAFGESKWSIREYAQVRGHELALRRDLLPAEVDHPRANEIYYKLQLGEVMPRMRPIVSNRGRRLLFLWTTWAKFSEARQFNDLFHKGAAHDKLWHGIQQCGLDAERELIVREGRSRYRVDFMIYCTHGRLAVMIDGTSRSMKNKPKLEMLSISGADLEDRFEGTLRKIERRARELN